MFRLTLTLPVFKSSCTQLWPILCCVGQSQPAIVALFLGKSKPSSVDEFLEDFVAEIRDLQLNNYKCELCDDSEVSRVPFVLHSVVCDAPARAFIKKIKGHNSLHACERCCAVGSSVRSRTIFTATSCFDAGSRCTEERFSSGAYLGSHQIGLSP